MLPGAFKDRPRFLSIVCNTLHGSTSFDVPLKTVDRYQSPVGSDVWQHILCATTHMKHDWSYKLQTLRCLQKAKSQSTWDADGVVCIQTWHVPCINALMLCVIAIPSFILLHSMDDVIAPRLTMKAIGPSTILNSRRINDHIADPKSGLVTYKERVCKHLETQRNIGLSRAAWRIYEVHSLHTVPLYTNAPNRRSILSCTDLIRQLVAKLPRFRVGVLHH